ERPRLGIDEGAAAGAEHDMLVAQQPGDHPRFSRTEFGLPVALEDLGDGHIGGLLDFLVAIDEVPAEPGREAPPYGSLARPHHADEHEGLRSEPGQQFVAPHFFRPAHVWRPRGRDRHGLKPWTGGLSSIGAVTTRAFAWSPVPRDGPAGSPPLIFPAAIKRVAF